MDNNLLPIEKDFKEVLIKISEKENYSKILEEIIEVNLKYNKEYISFDLVNNLNSVFEIRTDLILGYLTGEFTVNIEKINKEGKLTQIIDVLENLKNKYGLIISKSLNKSRNPIGLAGVYSSVGNLPTTYSSINILRNDEKSIEINCNGNDMLGFINALDVTFLTFLEKGIYNLQRENVDEFLRNNEILSNKLKELIEKSNG